MVRTIGEIVGLNIREKRKRLGLSQTELGAQAGLSLQAINRIEKGVAQPRKANVEAIARALSCSAENLYIDPSQASASQSSMAETIKHLQDEIDALKTHPLFSLLEIEEPSHQDTLLAAAEALKSEPPIGSLSRVAAPKKKYQK